MKLRELFDSKNIKEAPLPPDWDTSVYSSKTPFKVRLKYTLDRAKRLGTGSSRVATTIEYQGRPTVLKIAKNRKGMAQNSVEAEVLNDGYAKQLGILIPLIDYDTENADPTWLHMEQATKASESNLCKLMGCPKLYNLVYLAMSMIGQHRYSNPQKEIQSMKNKGASDEDIDKCSEYATKLAELGSSYNINLVDFNNPKNWGIYNGRPVIIDVGFSEEVAKLYKRF